MEILGYLERERFPLGNEPLNRCFSGCAKAGEFDHIRSDARYLACADAGLFQYA